MRAPAGGWRADGAIAQAIDWKIKYKKVCLKTYLSLLVSGLDLGFKK
jgi:hypothetical protein